MTRRIFFRLRCAPGGMAVLYELLNECRDYRMKDQMLRSSVFIPSNIAEGSERNSIPDFKRSLHIAKGSAAELRTQVYISREVEILSPTEAKDIIRELKSISEMLQSPSNSLKRPSAENQLSQTVNAQYNGKGQ
ncbi:MAG: four helix bundle protein [Proteobacteria bacterium]|nr:four helix bundle protein [Pseudomonadota bacterium]